VDERFAPLIAQLQFLRTLPPAAPRSSCCLVPRAAACCARSFVRALSDAPCRPESPAHIVHTRCATPTPRPCCAPVSACRRDEVTWPSQANMTLRYLEITQQTAARIPPGPANSTPSHSLPHRSPLPSPTPPMLPPYSNASPPRRLLDLPSVNSTPRPAPTNPPASPAPPHPHPISLPKDPLHPPNRKIGSDWPDL